MAVGKRNGFRGGHKPMVHMKSMQKLTTFVNALLMSFVLLMIGFFAHYGVTYMVYHSIPTLAMYVLFFVLINKEHLNAYVFLVYTVITIYMIAATICLGYSYGFHLYCMSLIPLTFYTEYLGYRLGTGKPFAKPMSIILVTVYLLCSSYAVLHGPVYVISDTIACLCLCINALCVFFFLVGYSSMLHKMVVDSERKLSDLAHTDQLTGLFNRHYMTAHLDGLWKDMTQDHWIAMIDIDNFKHINDEYGHNCGDYVLVRLSEIMREVCKECVICRWGGEEFLIASPAHTLDAAIMLSLREIVERTPFVYQEQEIPVTITSGVSFYRTGQSLDGWIQSADEKLYSGKNSGKNRVVF